jgi:hypothetical protein
VTVGNNTLPNIKRGYHLNPEYINRYDGFSVSAPILWHLNDLPHVKPERSFISYRQIELSLYTNATTLSTNLSNLTLHPHSMN